MKRSFTTTTLLWLLVAVAASAKLPDGFSGWQTRSFQPITKSQLPQVAGSNSALLREYGFVAGERREYVRNGATVAVTSWQMQDISGSFGLFSYQRDPGMETLEGDDRIAIGPDRVLVHRGLYVIEAQGAPLTLGDARLLLAEVPSVRNAASMLPTLPTFLPTEGLVADSP